MNNIFLIIGVIITTLCSIAMILFFIYTIKKNILESKNAKERYTYILTDLYEKIKLKSSEDIVLKENFTVKKIIID